ncbi:uncharacterized protein EI90DRAFT_497079 [Cantharellus anzutake]|uniref:uncharacterized protein n=1 Tax=Cantharellus anzutake TaxID=1750568 RepID=UPI001903A6C7|nr:uncharacterized protein EI90DRAFT_497079 [Cantharellus anzutake]KAF8333996.1 hypothetical protein EI90DRAFT_497079 [Cantharellus anzutake]
MSTVPGLAFMSQEMTLERVGEPEDQETGKSDSIAETIPIIQSLATAFEFRSSQDLQFIARVRDRVSKMSAQRKQQTDRFDEEHRYRVQQLKKLKLDAERPAGVLSAPEHAQKIERLQREKFDLTKEIGDIERDTDYASGELGRLRDEHAKLQARDVPGESAVDAAAIQLNIMTKLGVDLVSSGKVLLHSPTEAYVVDLNDGSSPFDKTNQIWDLISDIPRTPER